MGLGKQKAKLDRELFRRTEPQPFETKSTPLALQASEKVIKERFSLYLDPSLAKRLRLYQAEKGIKNNNAFIVTLIEKFLDKEGA